MVFYDTNALIITAAAAANSIPDPTTVPQRTHDLTNVSGANQTWTSSGPANPFTVDGSPAASLVIPPGRTRRLQSNGSTWVVAPTSNRRIFAGSGVSNASGDVVFTFSPAFSAVPDVAQGVQTSNTNATEARITALSASSCTVNVRQSPGVVILGISVLQVPQPLVGATVHIVAVEPGQGA